MPRWSTAGERHYRFLSVGGDVTAVTAEGAGDHIDRLARRYLDREEYPNEPETERVILRIRPDEVMHEGRARQSAPRE